MPSLGPTFRTQVAGKVEEVTAKVGEMMLGQQRLEAMLQTLLNKPEAVR